MYHWEMLSYSHAFSIVCNFEKNLIDWKSCAETTTIWLYLYIYRTQTFSSQLWQITLTQPMKCYKQQKKLIVSSNHLTQILVTFFRNWVSSSSIHVKEILTSRMFLCWNVLHLNISEKFGHEAFEGSKRLWKSCTLAANRLIQWYWWDMCLERTLL